MEKNNNTIPNKQCPFTGGYCKEENCALWEVITFRSPQGEKKTEDCAIMSIAWNLRIIADNG